MSFLWMILLIVRLSWSVAPQTGYIHPDEFFQTVEVVAGDAFNISVVRTWEFTSTYPLRSVVLPQIIFHPVFKLLRYAEEIFSFQVTGYYLVASYRLLMTLLSLWIDFCVYKICKVIGIQGHTANVLLASCYVTLTFQTHTFSNSLESLLFVTLILLILVCIRKDSASKRKRIVTRFFSEVDKFRDFNSESLGEAEDSDDSEIDEEELGSSFNDLHENAFNLRKRNKEFVKEMNRGRKGRQEKGKYQFGKDSGLSEIHSQKKQTHTDVTECTEKYNLYIYITLMAITVTVGLFNRPTFLIFAAMPLLWWTNKHPTGEIYVFKRATMFIMSGLLLSFVFVTMDTVYFSGLEISSLFTQNGWRKVLENCVITPLNFALYNSMATNLATHGFHPFYIHLCVNMPLLFGPMLVYLARHLIKEGLILLKVLRQDNEAAQAKEPAGELSASVEDNLQNDFKNMLWIFIFFPVIVLSLFPHQEARFLIPLLPLVVLSVVMFSNKLGKLFWTSFMVFNILVSIVFGTLHQGGVLPCLVQLQHVTQLEFMKNSNTSMALIFSHTYMPPKHVLLTQNPNLELIDLKGSDFQTVIDEIEKHKTLGTSLTTSDESKKAKKVLLVLPGTLVAEFRTLSAGLLHIKSQAKFFPHLSFEDPPDIGLIDSWEILTDVMSLHLIEII